MISLQDGVVPPKTPRTGNDLIEGALCIKAKTFGGGVAG